MSLEQQIQEDLKDAMRAKDTLRLEVIRGIKSQWGYYKIEKKLETLTDEDVLTVLRRSIKQRGDSIEEYQKAGRKELADKEQAELVILKKYLPPELSSEELTQIVKDTIAELGATDKKQMGQVMKAVMAKTKGRVDGKAINAKVGELLK